MPVFVHDAKLQQAVANAEMTQTGDKKTTTKTSPWVTFLVVSTKQKIIKSR